MSRSLYTADIFSAPGGLSLGFSMAGFRPLLAVDVDKYGTQTLAHNFPQTKILCKDIASVRVNEFLDEAGVKSKEIDVICGGPPCQGFSNVGRVKIASLVRKGVWKLQNGNSRMIDDPRNLLYKEFVRIVSYCQPKFFVMENVNGLSSYRDGHHVNEIKEDFEKVGYKVDFDLLDSADFSVPQHRKRIFFIGNRIGVANPFPEHQANKGSVTVWQAIGDLPSLRAGKGSEIMEYSKPAFHCYQQWARSNSSHVFNHVARSHTKRDLVTFKSMKPGSKWAELQKKYKDLYGYRDDIFNDKFKRLWKTKPSWTVTAHLSKDGYVYIHPTQSRTITVREAARLQSFPDAFVFKGPRTSQFRQVGNAVPPLMAKAIAIGLKKSLERYSGDSY